MRLQRERNAAAQSRVLKGSELEGCECWSDKLAPRPQLVREKETLSRTELAQQSSSLYPGRSFTQPPLRRSSATGEEMCLGEAMSVEEIEWRRRGQDGDSLKGGGRIGLLRQAKSCWGHSAISEHGH